MALAVDVVDVREEPGRRLTSRRWILVGRREGWEMEMGRRCVGVLFGVRA